MLNLGKYKDKDLMWVIENDMDYIQWAKKNLFSSYTLEAIREYYIANKK